MPPVEESGFVDIGGRMLHYAVAGQGDPAVVLVSGSGLDRRFWRRVMPGVAAFTRVLAYDRAGLGQSAPPPGVRDLQGPVDDLESLLEQGPVSPPYVLVAHSIGGFVIRLLASRHPDAVAGLVLVDANHEDYYERIRALATPDVWAAYLDRRRQRSGPELMESDVEKDAGLMAGTWPAPDVPVVVLARGAPDPRQEIPGIAVAQTEAVWQELQVDLAGRFADGSHHIAKGSGHHIPREQPETVIDAVRTVVDAARARPERRPL